MLLTEWKPTDWSSKANSGNLYLFFSYQDSIGLWYRRFPRKRLIWNQGCRRVSSTMVLMTGYRRKENKSEMSCGECLSNLNSEMWQAGRISTQRQCCAMLGRYICCAMQSETGAQQFKDRIRGPWWLAKGRWVDGEVEKHCGEVKESVQGCKPNWTILSKFPNIFLKLQPLIFKMETMT